MIKAAWVQSYAYGATSVEDMRESIRYDTLELIEIAGYNRLYIKLPAELSDGVFRDSKRQFELFLSELPDTVEKHIGIFNARPPGVEEWVDFRDGEVRLSQEQWVAELLATYPNVNGIHLDGIRFQGTDYKVDGCPVNDPQRREAVTDTVRRIRAVTGDKVLTVASRQISSGGHLSGGPFEFWEKDIPYMLEDGQDILSWIDNNLIDYAVTMTYTVDIDYWLYELECWKSAAPGQFLIGIGWEKNKNVEATMEKITRGEVRGSPGFCVFNLYDYPPDVAAEQELADAIGAI